MIAKISERLNILKKNRIKTVIYISVCIAVFFMFTLGPFNIWLNSSIESKGFTSVRGDSMSPTINNNDILYIDQLSFERGEIVCVMSPETPLASNLTLLKRIVGLPGETVEMTSNGVLINGVLLDEDYIADKTMTYQEENEYNEVILSDDEYFVLGDNRSESFDSRDVGAIHKSMFMYALTKEPNGYTALTNALLLCTMIGCLISIVLLPIVALFIITNPDMPKSLRIDSRTHTLIGEKTIDSKNKIVEKPYKQNSSHKNSPKSNKKKKHKKKKK